MSPEGEAPTGPEPQSRRVGWPQEQSRRREEQTQVEELTVLRTVLHARATITLAKHRYREYRAYQDLIRKTR